MTVRRHERSEVRGLPAGFFIMWLATAGFFMILPIILAAIATKLSNDYSMFTQNENSNTTTATAV